MVTIRRIATTDTSVFRDLRLRALKTDPLSFGSTWEKEAVRDDAFWAESTQRHAERDDQAIFLALDGDLGLGLVRTAADPARPGTFFIHSMWVAPDARRRGLAQQLLDAANAWAAGHGAQLSELMVTDRASTAQRLYARCGYAADGYTEPSPHSGVLEHRMVKRLTQRYAAGP